MMMLRQWRKLISSNMAIALSRVAKRPQMLIACPQHCDYALDVGICIKCASADPALARDIGRFRSELEWLHQNGIIKRESSVALASHYYVCASRDEKNIILDRLRSTCDALVARSHHVGGDQLRNIPTIGVVI
jgi:hypothetical protein